MNKYLFILFFFTYFLSYSQQSFTYQFYADETVREGVLFYNNLENTALYLDKVTQTKRVTNNKEGEDVSIASMDGDIDSFHYKEGNLDVFTQDLLKTNFLVEDILPEIKWELISEKKEIQNLVCYKAKAEFRGTNWIAWYCPEIPITYGPWKFYGLPGLIIEAKDDSNRFIFNLVSILFNNWVFWGNNHKCNTKQSICPCCINF